MYIYHLLCIFTGLHIIIYEYIQFYYVYINMYIHVCIYIYIYSSSAVDYTYTHNDVMCIYIYISSSIIPRHYIRRKITSTVSVMLCYIYTDTLEMRMPLPFMVYLLPWTMEPFFLKIKQFGECQWSGYPKNAMGKP